MKTSTALAALLTLVLFGPIAAEAGESRGDLRRAARLVTLPESPIDPELDSDWLAKAEQVLASNFKPWIGVVRAVSRKPGSLDRPDPNELRSLRELLWLRGRVAQARAKHAEVLRTAATTILLSGHVGREGNFAEGLQALALSSQALELLRDVPLTGGADLDALAEVLKLPVAPSLEGLCRAEARVVAKLAPGQVETFAKVREDWKGLGSLSLEKRIKRVDELFRAHADHEPYQRILRSFLDLEQKRDALWSKKRSLLARIKLLRG